MLTDARFKFALDSLKKCVSKEPRKNTFFSPHLMYHHLLLAYFGSSDDVEDSFRQILCIPNEVTKDMLKKEYMNGGVNTFCYKKCGNPNFPEYKYEIFNKLWLSHTKTLTPETLRLFSVGYQGTETKNFSKRNVARIYVNNCISILTECKIQELLPRNSIDSNTDVIMTNSMYLSSKLFRNDPTTVFEELFIKKQEFDEESLEHYSVEGDDSSREAFKFKIKGTVIRVTEVPLKRKDITILFIRLNPLRELFTYGLESDDEEDTKAKKQTETKKDTEAKQDMESKKYTEVKESKEEIEIMNLNKVIELLTTEPLASRYLYKWLEKGLPHVVRIYSSFKVEQIVQMNELLKILGLQELIPSELTTFTDDNLRLGDAVHRVNVQLTQNDLIASASNTFFTMNSKQYTQASINSDDIIHPCVCLIYDKNQHNILFCGVLWNANIGQVLMG